MNRIVSILILVPVVSVCAMILWFTSERSVWSAESYTPVIAVKTEVAAQSAIDLKRMITNVTKPSPAVSDTLASDSYLCTDPPEPAALGKKVYPIDPTYGELYFLGELFTAARCGDSRVKLLSGIKNNTYTLGSTIYLYEEPDENFRKTLNSIGFACDQEEKEDGSCKRWALTDGVPVKTILKLEPYHQKIEIDDCRICG